MLLQPWRPQLLQLPPHGLQVQLQPGGGAVPAPAVEGVECAACAAADRRLGRALALEQGLQQPRGGERPTRRRPLRRP
eukprot:scaffold100963_cov69-Phaeocystis_antarctica.AAC.4